MKLTRRGLAGAAALLAIPSLARAQAGWPDRPVRVIVGFPGGSTPDTAARVLVPHFTEVFGQPFVVENRAGAGGNIGTEAVARATDGHTLGVSINGPLATAPALLRETDVVMLETDREWRPPGCGPAGGVREGAS